LSLSLVLGSTVLPAAEPATLAGSWTLKIVVPQGTRTPGMVLVQQGDSVTGTYKAMRGEGPVTGKLTGNSFVLSTQVTTADASLTVEYRGTLTGDTLAGTVHMGLLGEAAFTGTRNR
jgi:hypothetical protein